MRKVESIFSLKSRLINLENLVTTNVDQQIKDNATETIKKLKRRIRAREYDQAMRSLGLTKVRGPVSGKIYWE